MRDPRINPGRERFSKKVTLLSFVLALLIIVLHTTNLEVYGITAGVWYHGQCWFRALTDVVVPVFFIVSGYLYFRNFSGEYWRKCRTRIFSLVLPYLIWNLIAWAYYKMLILIPMIARNVNSEGGLFSRSAYQGIVLGECNVTWFIRVLIYYVFTVPFLFPLIKSKLLGGGLVVALIAVSQFIGVRCVELLYLPMFVLGGVLGSCCRSWVEKRWSEKCSIASLLILILSTLVETLLLKDVKAFPCFYISLRVVQSLCVWIASDLLLETNIFNCELPWFVRASFFMYVSHSMILETVEKLIFILMGKNLVASIVDLMMAPVITLCIILSVAYVIRNHTPRLWGILCGGR